MGQCYIRNRGANKPLIIDYNTVMSSVNVTTNPITGVQHRQEIVEVGLKITPTILLALPTTSDDGITPRGTMKDATFVGGKYQFKGLSQQGVLSYPQLYYYVGLIIPSVTPNNNGWISTPAVYGNVFIGTASLTNGTWTSPNLPFCPRYVLYDGSGGYNQMETIAYWNGQLEANETGANLTCNENSITLTGNGAGKIIAWG